MSALVVDTSAWIDFFAGRPVAGLEEALAQGLVVLSPIVAAELVSGARGERDRSKLIDLLESLPLHPTPIVHWTAVGDLRRRLLGRGISVSTPDAHVAQCTLDLDGVLLTRDRIFKTIARHTGLRLSEG